MLTRQDIVDKINERKSIEKQKEDAVYTNIIEELNKYINGSYNNDICSCIMKKDEVYCAIIGIYDFGCVNLVNRIYDYYNQNKDKFGNNTIEFYKEYNTNKKYYEVFISIKITLY